MGTVKRGAVRAWGALLSIAVVVGAGVAASAPALADGREVGGKGSQYFLNDSWSSKANHEFNYGKSSDRVYTGDWNGDGKDTLAVRRGSTYYFANSLGGSATTVVNYGKSTDTVLVGDWDGDGKDTLAVRRGSTYYVSNKLSGGSASIVQSYGRTTDTTLVGDWNGDRKDTLGVRREAATAAAPTVAQKEAIEAARLYVEYFAFSRAGLIDQLTSEYGDGFRTADAEYAVAYLEKRGEVSWKKEAVEAAENYLDLFSFSRAGLIDQLTSEYGDQFTRSQAEYAADQVGL